MKEKQRQLIIEIMKEDEKSGLYTTRKQTAVEWLAEKYNYVTWLRNRDEISAEQGDEMRAHYLADAKEMEKQQIKEAFFTGIFHERNS